MTISINAEKSFDKIKHPFMTKTINKVSIEGVYIKQTSSNNNKRAISNKPITNIIVNSEKPKVIVVRSGT